MSCPLLLERDAQLQTLARLHDGTVNNGGCVVFVTGESGIGKTALVREFIRQRGTKAHALWGACDPLSTPQPLGPLRDVSRQVGGALLAALTEAGSRERIFASMLDELERAGERIILIIEDMHWADDATLDLLKYLGRRIARTRAMVIVTYRSEEVHSRHALQIAIGYLPGAVVQRVPLASLSEIAVAKMAQASGRSVEGLHAATSGNPFYVTELLSVPAGEIPPSVRDVALARIGRLSSEARKVAELIALVPGRCETWLIQEVLGTQEAAIDECVLTGMTRYQDGTLAFRHELSRQAVEDSVAPAESRALHARILRVLRESKRCRVSESRLVHHAARAADSAAILEFAPRAAAQAASVGARRESIACYKIALEHGTTLEPAARAALLDRLAYECYLTGRIDEAVSAHAEALELWRAAGDLLRVGDTLRWLSRLNWFLGHGERAEGLAMQAVASLEPLGASQQFAMACSNVSQLSMLSARVDRAVEWGERAMELAQRVGSDEIRAHSLNNIGAARARRVGDDGWKQLEQSLEISLRGGYPEHLARAYCNLFATAIDQRDYVTAAPYGEAGLAYCGERELDAWWLYMRAYRARSRFEQGAWSAAQTDVEDILSRPGLSVMHRLSALIVLGRIRARRGDEGVEAPLEEAYSLAMQTREPQHICMVACARAEAAWLREDLPGTLREAQLGLDRVQPSTNAWLQGELAFWVWRADGTGPARLPIAAAFRMHMQGDWDGAARAWASLGCRYEEAMALADSPDENARKRALELFEGLGARVMARRIRKQLQSEGVRGLKRGAHRATRANPAGLTTRELEILALVAENLSNAAIARRLFLSAKTVGHHASAILSKLGISSRREAAEAARKLGIDLSHRERTRRRAE
jgi:ATP/maltotriose-dependent transcriptional regulator MalT